MHDPDIAAYKDVIVQDLGRLNDVRTGLGDTAAAYVLTGEGRSVLPSIATLVTDDQLQIHRLWPHDKGTSERRRLLARAHPYDVEIMQRYVDVLSAPVTSSAPQSAAGTHHVPKKVRVFFSEAFIGLTTMPFAWFASAKLPQGQGLVLDKALLMLQRLGGTLADLVDVLYAAEGEGAISGRGYRSADELGAWFAAHAAAVEEAMARLPLAARLELLKDLRDWGVVTHEPYTELFVRQAGVGSKAVHEAAVAALTAAPPAQVEKAALQLLAAGDATQRAGMVDLLARLPLPGAQAALAAHREKDKTARILTAIDTALAIVAECSAPAVVDCGGQGYTAIDGRHISIPPPRPLRHGPVPRFGDAEARALSALIAAENEAITQRNAGKVLGIHRLEALIDPNAVDGVIRFLNGEGAPPERTVQGFLDHGSGARWLREVLSKLPDSRAIPLLRSLGSGPIFKPRLPEPGAARMDAYLRGSDADLRTIEALDVAAGSIVVFGFGPERCERPAQKGDSLRSVLHEGGRWYRSTLSDIPDEALWPYLAENLEVLDEALGLVSGSGVPLDRAAALEMLTRLPAVPARYYTTLLESACGETKSGRTQARALLSRVPGVEDRLIELLRDSRQDVRVGAAEWLAARGAKGAVAALHKRLKVEKSERVRAALLTALASLGEDLSQAIGPEVLLAEARHGLKSVKGDTLSFLGFTDLAPLHYRDGSRVPVEVLRWWCQLALKLKQPGGNALLTIYLDQLTPEGAEAFSTWVLESWLAYDIALPSEADAEAYAKQNAIYQSSQPRYTEALANLKAHFLTQYLNSGAASKGVLALAVRTPATLSAQRVRAYLRAHGARISQAGALLELLAGIGEPVALQTVIAAATRLKQKSLQRLAGQLVTALARERGWTLDELADRTVPTAGFDSNGILRLPCGEDRKPYEARLAPDLSIMLRNPAGKEVASLPAGEEAVTQDSRKQLSTAKKLLKQIIATQSVRLYEALCAQRSWSPEDWLRSFHAHPVMRRLIQQLVWVGIAEDGRTETFRPTEEGDFSDAHDQPVDVAAFREIRLGCGALLDEATRKAWLQYLGDYKVIPLVRQFGRALLEVSAQDGAKTMIEDREGWVCDAFTIRFAAGKLGYERGPVLDAGFFNEYRKSFQSLGLTAVVFFTGNFLPEKNVPAAIKELSFQKAGASRYGGGPVKLSEVPTLLLSECWNDYHAISANAAYDPEWKRRFRC